MKRKYLFFDIDGTIAENDNPPSELTKYALQQLRHDGHYIFICTGRPLCDIYPEITSVGFDGTISSAGANIFVDKHILFHSVIPNDLLAETVQRMNACNISGVLEASEQLYIVEGSVPLSYPIEMTYIKRLEHLSMAKNIEKFTFHLLNTEQADPIISFVEHYYEIYQLDVLFYEMVLKGCNKGAAIDFVLHYFNVSPKDAFGFGDSLNDCSMFDSVGTRVSMGNAPQILMDKSSMITGTIWQEGVYNALLELNFINKAVT